VQVVRDLAVFRQELDVGTVDLDLPFLAGGSVLLAPQRGEAPVLGHDDLLATRELVLGTAESLDGGGAVGILGAERQDDLANVDAGDGAVRLAPGATHTGLQTICTGARQHLVDADDVVRVAADTEMETVFSGCLDHVLVGADTGGFEGFGAQLLVLVGDEVDAQRELIDTGALPSEVENTDLRVGDTTVEAGLGERLVLAVAVATSGTASHFDDL